MDVGKVTTRNNPHISNSPYPRQLREIKVSLYSRGGKIQFQGNKGRSLKIEMVYFTMKNHSPIEMPRMFEQFCDLLNAKVLGKLTEKK